MSEQIDQFFAPNGTLISIPVKAAKKIAVLKVIASKLSPDTKYPEKELNAIIATYDDAMDVWQKTPMLKFRGGGLVHLANI